MLKSRTPDSAAVGAAVNSLSHNGAWVNGGGMRYHKKTGDVVDMRTTVKNLNLLADFLSNH